MASFIHDRMRFFFVHIPKTGGMSVSRFFYPNGNIRRQRLDFSLKNEGIGIHDGVEVISDRLGPAMPDYFSFAFYRNTWDWTFSLYRYIKKTPSHPRHAEVAPLQFEDYVFDFAETFYRPQRPLVTLEGKGVVKRLEDYRDFSGAFHDILEELGYDDIDIPHENAAEAPADYRAMYTPKMMVKIGNLYEEDIAYFGFRF